MRIEQATLDDVDILLQIGLTSFVEAFAAQNNPDDFQAYLKEAFNKEQIKQELQHKESLFYLAYLENTVVGYLKFNVGRVEGDLESEKSIEIQRIYTLRKHYGKGVGKALMQHAIETARDLQKPWLWLGVWEHNDRAVAFYKKWGFEIFGTHEFAIGADIQTDYLMKKRVF